MATKTAAKKKTTTTKKASTTTTRKAPVKKTTAPVKSSGGYGVLTERCPEDHVATGKYKFFFTFFGLTTIIFAAVAIWMFFFSQQILEKWEMLDVCARTGTTCEVIVKETPEEDEDETDDQVETESEENESETEAE